MLLFAEYIREAANNVDQLLSNLIAKKNTANLTRLYQAMLYSLTGGKRLRALLVYATGDALDAPHDILHIPAMSVELIHAYSLIHDDLPSMDDDALRRGQPSCHIAFDEATAILAGDALQALAFEILTNPKSQELSDNQKTRMVYTLAKASGYHGMILGQAQDLAAENNEISLIELMELHQNKSGALITASIQLGIIASNCQDNEILDALFTFANKIGLAFQIHDDILDITSNTETLGKPNNSDQKNQKTTFPSLIGLNESKEKANSLFEQALDAIKPLGNKSIRLQELAEYFIKREY